MLEWRYSIPLTADVQRCWNTWLHLVTSRTHPFFCLEGGTLDRHIAVCLTNAVSEVRRVVENSDQSPKKVLEVGCSTGFKSIALSQIFPNSEVHGIEPDEDAVAVAVAKGMAMAARLDNTHIRQGVGENLPYEDGTFDLIVCLTVIEHVQDVGKVIAEMSRVLAPGGVIHLEAPNYIWPYEPHLEVLCVPLFGKKFVSLLARLQGKSRTIAFLDHLKFVTPGQIEGLFARNGLKWDNLFKLKLEKVFDTDFQQVVAYKRISKILGFLGRVGLKKWLVRLIIWSGLYPSILYMAKKP